ncbi:hypothetical protein B0H14DRAFT_2938807, partial [Mycena olivaceomarginata]
KCVLFPHRPCLSCSLFLAFSSLGSSACFSPIAHVVLLTFSCLLVSSFLTDRFGIRAFFKHGATVNHSLFHGQG